MKAPASPTAPTDASGAKAIHDAAAFIRGLAQLRGRNAEWAERAVREAVSLTADEALAEGVIDVVAEDVDELLASTAAACACATPIACSPPPASRTSCCRPTRASGCWR